MRKPFLTNNIPMGGVGAEIGVWQGGTSADILRHRKPDRLYLIDPWIFEQDGLDQWIFIPNRRIGNSQEGMDKVYESVVERFKNDDRVIILRLKSVEAAQTFPDESFDWLYIDGAHDYKSVKADFNAWKNKVKVGGLLMGDDYLWAPELKHPVRRAVNEFIDQNRNFKVIALGEVENQIILKRMS